MLEQRKAMMAWVHMQKTSLGLTLKIADSKAQQTPVEGQHRIKIRNHKHDMAHAQGPSAKARDIAARRKRRVSQQWPVKDLDPVSIGIMKRNEASNKPLIGKRRRFTSYGNAR